MADVSISYKNTEIATMNATGVKTLLTGDCFCEDDIVVAYTKPAAPTPTLQSKTVSPSTSQQTVSPDSGYDGLSSVKVNAMPSGSATTPATTITANPTISVSASGLITASVSKTQGVTPTVSAGYVSSGTAGTVTVNGSATQQISDANFIPENIKDGVTIFGVTGTYTGGGGGSYTVTVSLTNPISPSDFSGCNIYEATINDIEDAMDHPSIASISSASGSTSVTIPSSSYGIVVDPEGRWGSTYDKPDVTCTGKIACIGKTFFIVPSACIFLVGGDGTITIDSIDYGD